MGFFSSKKRKPQVMGYRYSLGMHMIAGHGNMDSLEKIRVGEKVVWSGNSYPAITLKDYYSSGEDNYAFASVPPTDDRQLAQTFTASSGYTIGSVKLKIYKESGSGFDLLVQLQEVDGSGHPNGTVRASGIIIDANISTIPTWIFCNFTLEYTLISERKYAIVVIPQTGNGEFRWRLDQINATYPGGNYEVSQDGGLNWTALTGHDFMFKTYEVVINPTIYINSPNIFGGDRKEGGVQGYVDLMFGDITQSQNVYLKARLNDDIPAYRGLWSAVLNQVYIGTSAYLKPWSFLLKRVAKQISGEDQWNLSRAVINENESDGDDLNPAHIIRECLINPEWGCGWSVDDIDSNSFERTADILYFEEFGLSMLWDQVIPIEDFINEVLNYIAGVLYQDLETGKWVLSLVRDRDSETIELQFAQQESYILGMDDHAPVYRYNSNVVTLAQSFTVLFNYDIAKVVLKLHRLGSFAYATVGIYATDVITGKPTGSALCSARVGDFNITTNEAGEEVSFLFANPASLIQGTKYAIILSTPSDEGDYIYWHLDSTEANYAGGNYLISNDGGSTWLLDIDYDFYFKTYKLNIDSFNENDIISVEEFARPAPGEIINFVEVKWWDKLACKSRSVEVRDLALIEKQGGAIVEKILNYQGICNATLANKVAERELKLASSMLAGIKLRCTRKMAHLKPNDIFKLTWNDLGISQMIVRVLDVDYGSLNKNEIYLNCVEDLFSTAETIYGDPSVSLWTDPISEPVDITNRRLIEIPYWTLCNDVIGSFSLVAALDNDAGYLCVIAGKPADDYFDYDILARLSASYSFKDEGLGNNSFTPIGILTNDLAMNAEDVTIDLSSEFDLDLVEVDSYAIIDDEIVKVLSIDTDNNRVEIARGILDTVPAAHSATDIIYFMELNFGEIDVEYTKNDTPSVKLLPRTAKGSLETTEEIETADALDSRMIRPYPPGNLKFNAESYPEWISSGANGNKIRISWNHRDRTDAIQLNSLVEHSDSSIGPESGVAYTIEVYGVHKEGDAEAEGANSPYTGEVGLYWDYTEAMEAGGGGDFAALQGQLRFVIYAVRGGIKSWKDGYDITLRRSFRGTVDATSSLSGWLIPYFDGRRDCELGSSVSGILNVETELGSSIVETSGASGSLGSLEVATELQGCVAGTSNVSSSLNPQLEFEGSVVGASGIDGDLSIAIDYYISGMDSFTPAYWVGGNNVWLAQTFTASKNYDITKVILKLYRAGSPGNITLSIQELDGANKPDGVDLCSVTIDGNSITTDSNGEEVTFTFGSPASLTLGTKYAIVLSSPVVETTYVYWKFDSAGTYAGGNYGISNDGGSAWTLDTNIDFYFKTYN